MEIIPSIVTKRPKTSKSRVIITSPMFLSKTNLTRLKESALKVTTSINIAGIIVNIEFFPLLISHVVTTIKARAATSWLDIPNIFHRVFQPPLKAIYPLKSKTRKVEKKWYRKVSDMFKEDFGLGEKDLAEYKKIMTSYSEERTGNLWRYFYEGEFEDTDYDLREKYLTRLLDLIGEENYYHYATNREDFNDEIENLDMDIEDLEAMKIGP